MSVRLGRRPVLRHPWLFERGRNGGVPLLHSLLQSLFCLCNLLRRAGYRVSLAFGFRFNRCILLVTLSAFPENALYCWIILIVHLHPFPRRQGESVSGSILSRIPSSRESAGSSTHRSLLLARGANRTGNPLIRRSAPPSPKGRRKIRARRGIEATIRHRMNPSKHPRTARLHRLLPLGEGARRADEGIAAGGWLNPCRAASPPPRCRGWRPARPWFAP